MSEPKKDEGKKDDHGGGHGGGVSKAWGFAILAIVLIYSGILESLGDQLGFFLTRLTTSLANFLQVLKNNFQFLMAVAVIIFIGLAIKANKGKDGDGH